jgi:hypothetical protein
VFASEVSAFIVIASIMALLLHVPSLWRMRARRALTRRRGTLRALQSAGACRTMLQRSSARLKVGLGF